MRKKICFALILALLTATRSFANTVTIQGASSMTCLRGVCPMTIFGFIDKFASLRIVKQYAKQNAIGGCAQEGGQVERIQSIDGDCENIGGWNVQIYCVAKAVVDCNLNNSTSVAPDSSTINSQEDNSNPDPYYLGG